MTGTFSLLLALLAVDVLGIALVYWLAAHDRWARRCAGLGERLWIFLAVPVVVLPPLWLMGLVVWFQHGPLLPWCFAGPLAAARLLDLDLVGWLVTAGTTAVMLAAMVSFPLRPRWWTAMISSVGITAWLLVGLAILGSGV